MATSYYPSRWLPPSPSCTAPLPSPSSPSPAQPRLPFSRCDGRRPPPPIGATQIDGSPDARGASPGPPHIGVAQINGRRMQIDTLPASRHPHHRLAPDETILLDGCDFKHCLVIMEPPLGDDGNSDIRRDEIIDSYIKTLTQVVGSEKEARQKIYRVSTHHYLVFGALVSEELSYKLKGIFDLMKQYVGNFIIKYHRMFFLGSYDFSSFAELPKSDDLHQGPQPYQKVGVSFFLKSETEEMNFSEKFDVELNKPYLVFKLDNAENVIAVVQWSYVSKLEQT
ncbi:hypothetical protein C2845_PM09G10950 [Panicum miliaceum]|uniref:MORF/ORRM1/DAG-like MORF domain-containing protein n=1 Tax=Panicum miliaceum TaxID=4540 RepID=A0A3L6RYW5_PANMI|nr:hypothetical protein C2845_PM09G10950 [Panicum miliaceum]